MLPIAFIEGPDVSLAWLLYALLAFVLLNIVIGALAGAGISNTGAPGPLGGRNGDAAAQEAPHDQAKDAG